MAERKASELLGKSLGTSYVDKPPSFFNDPNAKPPPVEAETRPRARTIISASLEAMKARSEEVKRGKLTHCPMPLTLRNRFLHRQLAGLLPPEVRKKFKRRTEYLLTS